MSKEADGWRKAIAQARAEGYREAIAEVMAHVDGRCESAADDIAAVQNLSEKGEDWRAQYAHVLGVWLTWVEIQTALGFTVGVQYADAPPVAPEAPTSAPVARDVAAPAEGAAGGQDERGGREP